jgi:hypothetical protein
VPVIQKETSVPANSTVENVFQGSGFEFMRGPSVVSIGSVAAATGLFITIQAGPTIVLEESPPSIRTTMPVQPDDFFYNLAAAPGDRLICRVRNSTGAAVVLRTIAQITER